ncbi:carboxymuconolactone decarboxylase family protein [Corynebacterium lubricantis]|uniref:carboxymuconolactone decarboxylase family protein n=1 Tax=Corynebacterium lubricantis TaxID=541095 RepID=UPI0003707531|nr:carboxymuconolactone decarboxylase family protein [Corynebacterium lubricantis]
MAHIDLMKTHKRTYAATGALELAARTGISRDQRLLVQLRASMINGCQYCIDMHSKEALENGKPQSWVDSIRDWRPGEGTFSEAENLIIEFASMGTKLSEGYDRQLQERVVDCFGEKVAGALISQVVAINAWNRLSVLSEK